MKGFGVLFGKELREQLRTYRIAIVAVVFILFGIMSPVMARYMKELFDALGSQAAGGMTIIIPAPTVPDAVSQLLKNLAQFGILIGILLAAGSVAAEKDRGTAGLILTKPASRLAFLAAKLCAIGVNLAIAVALGCAIAYAYIVLLYDNAQLSTSGYIAMAFLLWLALMAYASLTFLGSTLTRSTVAAAGFGAIAFVGTSIVAAMPTIGKYMPLGLTIPGTDLAVGKPMGGDLIGPVLAALLFTIVPVVLAWLSFRRQEL